MTVYSFRDLTGAFVHPNVGSFVLAGPQLGVGQISINMITDRSVHDVAADGNIMVSYVPGDNGHVVIEMQQTCALNSFLVLWFDTIKTQADGGNVSYWASGTIALRNLVDGSNHIVTGVSPLKIPDKVYAAAGQRLTWTLLAASVITQ